MPPKDKEELKWGAPTFTTSVQGPPLEYYQHELDIRRRANQIARKNYLSFGPSPERIAAIKKELEELYKGYKTPKTAHLSFAVTPHSKPVQFTERQLAMAAHDKDYAYTIFSESTGLQNPTRSDVMEFQKRIREKFPAITRERPAGPSPFSPQDIEAELAPARSERAKLLAGPHEVPAHLRGAAAPGPAPGPAPVPLPLEQFATRFARPGQNLGPTDFLGVLPARGGGKNIPGWQTALQVFREAYDNYAAGRVPYEDVTKALNNLKNTQIAGGWAPTGGAPAGNVIPDNFALLERGLGAHQTALSAHQNDVRAHQQAQELYNQRLQAEAQVASAKAEQERIKANLPNIEKEEEENARRELEQGFLGRVGFEQREKRELDPMANVAPMNELHAEAERLMHRNVGTQDEDNEYIKRNVHDLQWRPQLPNVVKPYLDEGTKHPASYMNIYHNAHENAVINHMRKQAEENFLEKVLPTINSRYGARSGLRESMIRTHALKMDRELQRNIADLRARNFDNAMKMSDSHRGLQMQGAQIAGNAERQYQSDVLGRMDALGTHNLRQKGMAQADAQMLQNAAHQKQVQKQNEIEGMKKEQAQKEAWERDLIQFEANIANKLPATASVVSQVAHQGAPNPPNPLAFAGGIGAQMAGMPLSALPPKSKTGGHMRFADGGLAEHEGIMQNYAHRLANPSFDAYGSWLSHMAPALYSVAGAPEMAHSARAFTASQEAHKDREQKGLHDAGSLHSMIMNSKLQQRKILEDYKMHRETLGENKRHHLAEEDLEGQKVAYKTRPHIVRIGDKTYNLPARTDQERSHEMSQQQALTKEHGEIAKQYSKSAMDRMFGNSALDERKQFLDMAESIASKHDIPLAKAEEITRMWIADPDTPVEDHIHRVLAPYAAQAPSFDRAAAEAELMANQKRLKKG